MNKKKIVYIHGFGGSPFTQTVGFLNLYYPDYEWCALEVDHHAGASIKKINDFAKENDVFAMMGTSLGGFYVLCSDFTGPKLVINPVIEPMKSLKKSVGTVQYHARRSDGATSFKFTMQDLFEFKKFKFVVDDNVTCHHTEHDELLGDDIKRDYEKIFKNRKMCPKKTLPSHIISESYVKHEIAEYLSVISTKA